jgi:exodeoxyribonuclease V alpha subunit
MKRFNPLGTLKEKQSHTYAPRSPDDWRAIVEALTRAADHSLGLSPSLVWSAVDLVRLEDLEGEDRLATLLLAISVLGTVRNGSTRLALDAEQGEGVLRHTFERLAEALPQQQGRLPSAEPLADRAVELVRDGQLSHLVGEPEAFRPLILEHDSLYLEKTRRFEVRLVEHIEARLDEGRHLPFPEAQLHQYLDQVEASMPFHLTDLQREAVGVALREPLALITGGPGTGKTSIVASMLRVLVRIDVPMDEVALTAPTGQAADRIGEALAEHLGSLTGTLEPADRELRDHLPEPQTLHRLLGYSPARDTFHRDAHNPLDAQVVIVDEASMVDLFLMEALFQALEPETRLVLLGDADQLPSVEAGAVFRDLVPSDEEDETGASGGSGSEEPTQFELIPGMVEEETSWGRADDENETSGLPTRNYFVALTENHRTHEGAERLDTFARAINSGEAGHPERLSEEFVETIEALDRDDTPVGVYHRPFREHELEASPIPFVAAWYDAHVGWPEYPGSVPPYRREPMVESDPGGYVVEGAVDRLRELVSVHQATRMLCLTRVYDTGAERLNEEMHRIFAEQHGLEREMRFYPGEPVVMLSNNYELDLFNGDQGIVLYTRRADEEEAKKRIVFPTSDGFRDVELGRIRPDIELCWAMTVHRSQGSEFQHVGLVLPDLDEDDERPPLLNRELLYTAVTRAKRSVTLFGATDVFSLGVRHSTRRVTGIRERLNR